MKRIKNVSVFFGLLDLLSLILISHQEYAILANYRLIPEDALSQTKVVLLLITYPLLFVAAIGFFRFKKFSFIVYYFLFPVRLLIWIFSFGFLSFLRDYTTDPALSDWLFRLPIILEFFRLYYTVKIHRDYFR